MEQLNSWQETELPDKVHAAAERMVKRIGVALTATQWSDSLKYWRKTTGQLGLDTQEMVGLTHLESMVMENPTLSIYQGVEMLLSGLSVSSRTTHEDALAEWVQFGLIHSNPRIEAVRRLERPGRQLRIQIQLKADGMT